MSADYKKCSIDTLFGSNVFSDHVMEERLPSDTYKALKKTIDEGAPLNPQVAETVADAMKNWAIERGATHYTHWFQPLNGVTAEKHESFIQPLENGKAITEFSGKMLIKGESDASSFPSGGLRATFEARGYTMWDCSSPAFLKEDKAGVTLCIPTAFCSYNGEALDQKTPLLRSMEALNKQALRILRLFGDTQTKRVITTVGAEQEYFLIDREKYLKRLDLKLTGRTLIGAKPPKAQELEDHYYGVLSETIALFMSELDSELWKMGISAKTKHNEVAPSQHELAPIFCSANIAADQNQLIMETMKKVANRFGLACLLHEKPFSYINGSGKHNNWSICTDSGQNLFDPGKTPTENARFLLFLCAVIRAVDKHAELLRLSASSAANDHRLGGCEAPPAIISIFLGEELEEVLGKIKKGSEISFLNKTKMKFNLPYIPDIYKDTTDRNRTSPFAFTGNKFEFRMLGSSMPIAECNTIINTIVAESLDDIANRLEMAVDFESEVLDILRDILKTHDRIIFDGNNYAEEWVNEAAKRGLPNIPTTVDAIPVLLKKQTIDLFERYGVFTKSELEARCEILYEKYAKEVLIEAKTLYTMLRRELIPAVNEYMTSLADTYNLTKAAGCVSSETRNELSQVSSSMSYLYREVKKLKTQIDKLPKGSKAQALHAKNKLLPLMGSIREICDSLEEFIPKKYYPFPTYEEMLFDI